MNSLLNRVLKLENKGNLISSIENLSKEKSHKLLRVISDDDLEYLLIVGKQSEKKQLDFINELLVRYAQEIENYYLTKEDKITIQLQNEFPRYKLIAMGKKSKESEKYFDEFFQELESRLAALEN